VFVVDVPAIPVSDNCRDGFDPTFLCGRLGRRDAEPANPGLVPLDGLRISVSYAGVDTPDVSRCTASGRSARHSPARCSPRWYGDSLRDNSILLGADTLRL
jgi:hypothetical protein